MRVMEPSEPSRFSRMVFKLSKGQFKMAERPFKVSFKPTFERFSKQVVGAFGTP
jgi:hypothetical protein